MTKIGSICGVRVLAIAFAAVFCSSPVVFAADAPLVANAPIIVPESKGEFDYLQVDAKRSRLLINHTGDRSLAAYDLTAKIFLRPAYIGQVRGVAVDESSSRYFLSTGTEQMLAFVDAPPIKMVSMAKLPGAADALAYVPKNNCIYVDQAGGTRVWVVSIQANAVIATINVPAEPEYILYDAVSDRIYQNIKSIDSLVVIDPNKNVITERWPTAPAKSPHGLAIDTKAQRLYCAGYNGKLAVLDAKTGKLLASVDIAPQVDQVAFDAGNQRVYCASSTGVISVVQATAEGAKSLGDVKTAPGAHSVAVDPKSHDVWVAYAEPVRSYIMRLQAK